MKDVASSHRRVALYSHDTQGLGHIRRNSLIAAALVDAHPDLDVLLLTGAPEATALPLPPRTSVVQLPALCKTSAGLYRPRSMPLTLDAVVAIRSAVLEGALIDFAPDLLVVDKVPLGIMGELEPGLVEARARFGTRTVLGLRDVLDEPGVAVREWSEAGSDNVVRRHYDEVWVYSDPKVYDPALEYGWPAMVRRKIAYTGYLGRGRSRLLARPASATGSPGVTCPEGPFVLCLVGGGQDGVSLSRAFVETRFPPGHTGVLITGPYLDAMARWELEAVAADREDLTVLDFVGDVPSFVNRAAATVAMGGYNTVCELLDSGQPVLLSPRTTPRREQAVRAERFRSAGLVDVVTPEQLTAAHLEAWLARAVHLPRRGGPEVDLSGLGRIPELADRLLDARRERPGEVDDVAV